MQLEQAQFTKYNVRVMLKCTERASYVYAYVCVCVRVLLARY